jgi:hypothetical protein
MLEEKMIELYKKQNVIDNDIIEKVKKNNELLKESVQTIEKILFEELGNCLSGEDLKNIVNRIINRICQS